MKSIIKTITTLLVFVITFTSAEFSNANNSTADTLSTHTVVDKKEEFRKYEKSLLYGFKSDVTGILEATLFNAVAYKTLNPDFNSAPVIDEITRLAVEKGNHVVRYKALLTLSYLKDQESFDIGDSIEQLIHENDANGTFRLLVDSIRDRQLAETQK